MNTFYCTNTIKNNVLTEDKGLYVNGLEHATQCQIERMKQDVEIQAVALLPDDGSKPIVIKREDIK